MKKSVFVLIVSLVVLIFSEAAVPPDAEAARFVKRNTFPSLSIKNLNRGTLQRINTWRIQKGALKDQRRTKAVQRDHNIAKAKADRMKGEQTRRFRDQQKKAKEAAARQRDRNALQIMAATRVSLPVNSAAVPYRGHSQAPTRRALPPEKTARLRMSVSQLPLKAVVSNPRIETPNVSNSKAPSLVGPKNLEKKVALNSKDVQKLVGRSNANESNPKSASQAVKLSGDLAIRERDTALKNQKLESGVLIAGGGSKKFLRQSNRLAAAYGGRPRDWIKKSSSAYIGRDGRRYSTHWYENSKTGKRVEEKVVVDEPGKGRVSEINNERD